MSVFKGFLNQVVKCSSADKKMEASTFSPIGEFAFPAPEQQTTHQKEKAFFIHQNQVNNPTEEKKLLKPGLPDVSWCDIPTRGKIYQIATKYTRWS
jgi:hypothetical protein